MARRSTSMEVGAGGIGSRSRSRSRSSIATLLDSVSSQTEFQSAGDDLANWEADDEYNFFKRNELTSEERASIEKEQEEAVEKATAKYNEDYQAAMRCPPPRLPMLPAPSISDASSNPRMLKDYLKCLSPSMFPYEIVSEYNNFDFTEVFGVSGLSHVPDVDSLHKLCSKTTKPFKIGAAFHVGKRWLGYSNESTGCFVPGLYRDFRVMRWVVVADNFEASSYETALLTNNKSNPLCLNNTAGGEGISSQYTTTPYFVYVCEK